MTDIKLIVKIDADVYTRLFDNGIQDNEIATDDICEMARALRLGKPLPKGHGDLKDASKMIADLNTVRIDNYAETIEWTCNVIDSYPTIIEADKEVDE